MQDCFSNRLIYAMSLRHVRIVDLSYLTGIRKSKIKQYLNDLREPKAQAIHDLSLILDVSEEWLMGLNVPIDRSHHTDI